jgi:hypothetical protein
MLRLESVYSTLLGTPPLPGTDFHICHTLRGRHAPRKNGNHRPGRMLLKLLGEALRLGLECPWSIRQ